MPTARSTYGSLLTSLHLSSSSIPYFARNEQPDTLLLIIFVSRKKPLRSLVSCLRHNWPLPSRVLLYVAVVSPFRTEIWIVSRANLLSTRFIFILISIIFALYINLLHCDCDRIFVFCTPFGKCTISFHLGTFLYSKLLYYWGRFNCRSKVYIFVIFHYFDQIQYYRPVHYLFQVPNDVSLCSTKVVINYENLQRVRVAFNRDSSYPLRVVFNYGSLHPIRVVLLRSVKSFISEDMLVRSRRQRLQQHQLQQHYHQQQYSCFPRNEYVHDPEMVLPLIQVS